MGFSFGFGSKKSKTSTSGTEKGTISRQLEIDEEGVEKILADILGSEQGLASIFAKENVAGIFDSSVAAQASGDLIANLAGEIAKLQAKKVETRDITTTGTNRSKEGGTKIGFL